MVEHLVPALSPESKFIVDCAASLVFLTAAGIGLVLVGRGRTRASMAVGVILTGIATVLLATVPF